jgi:hypothetical protein
MRGIFDFRFSGFVCWGEYGSEEDLGRGSC